MTTPAPGWHPDPTDPTKQRYWDGAAWTDHTAPTQEPPAQKPPAEPAEVAAAEPATPKPPKRTGTPWFRRTWVLVAAAGIIGLVVGLAIGAGSSSSDNSDTKSDGGATAGATVTVAPTATVTTTFTPKPAATVKDGTFLVPGEIQPGIWHTDGESKTGAGCYWERMANLSGGLDSIIANDNINGPTTIEIAPTDKAVKFSGGCTWAKTG